MENLIVQLHKDWSPIIEELKYDRTNIANLIEKEIEKLDITRHDLEDQVRRSMIPEYCTGVKRTAVSIMGVAIISQKFSEFIKQKLKTEI